VLHIIQTSSEAHHPPFQWLLGALSPGVKQLGSGGDHAPPTIAEVKKTWIYTYNPPNIFMFKELSTGTALPFFFYLFYLWPKKFGNYLQQKKYLQLVWDGKQYRIK
jgi:hypothetical protein